MLRRHGIADLLDLVGTRLWGLAAGVARGLGAERSRQTARRRAAAGVSRLSRHDAERSLRVAGRGWRGRARVEPRTKRVCAQLVGRTAGARRAHRERAQAAHGFSGLVRAALAGRALVHDRGPTAEAAAVSGEPRPA